MIENQCSKLSELAENIPPIVIPNEVRNLSPIKSSRKESFLGKVHASV
jgi:hypothetical protein